MPCFYPLPAIQSLEGTITIYSTIKNNRPPPGVGKHINLPCGRCIGCRLQRATNWATRCLHESQQHKENAFLTLTYSPIYPEERDSTTAKPVDDREEARELSTIAQDAAAKGRRKRAHVGNSRSNLRPEIGGLSINEHKKFMKRLRKKVGPLRFYMCGEYGEKLGRPHYHYLLFGYNFPDRYYHKTTESGEKLYRSPTLEKIWPYGHAWIGDVTYESCAYVAAYVMKKMTGEKAWNHYKRTDEAGNDYWLTPEFNLMSRKPGIAAEWWEQFHPDIYTHDAVIRVGGHKTKPPRYYDKLLELMDPAAMAMIKLKREIRARELKEDNTPQRLADKETVLKAKLNLKKRNLEQS